MRYIGLLIALLAVGWLVMTQLQSTSTTAMSTDTLESTGTSETQSSNVPTQAPRNGEELRTFEEQINSLATDQNARAQEALEQTQ